MDLSMLQKMKHSPLRNYAGVPGLTSWLIGEKGPQGCVRLFECERNHDEAIIPHSHRFDFHCVVLAGSVRNVLFVRSGGSVGPDEDAFCQTNLIYGGQCGTYSLGETRHVVAYRSERQYMAGETYGMKAHEIHSIFFRKGAKVLFFEGPQVADHSVIFEPIANGERVPTFKVEPWMFMKPVASEAKP